MPEFKTCTHGAEVADSSNEFDTLAHFVGSRFDRFEYRSTSTATALAARGRKSLETIAREHLGTAAVAVLLGVVYR